MTGGSGFIGSALVRRLVARDCVVTNLDALTYAAVPGALEVVEKKAGYHFVEGSISEEESVERAFSSAEPTFVVNLAAETHVDRSIDGPSAFVQTNLVGTATLLKVALSYWKALDDDDSERFRIVHVSTDEVFGSADVGAFAVDTPYDPSSPYAATKAGSDHLVRAWHRTYGLPTIVTNCSNNYGPFQFPEKLIPLVIVRALSNRPIPIYGDGRQVRDWIHVDDHVAGLELAAEGGEPGSTYLFGTDNARSNLDVVHLICSHLDRVAPRADGRDHSTEIEFVEDRPGHDRRYSINPAGAESIGFEGSVEFEAGIAETVEWYVANAAWWHRILKSRYDTTRLGVP